MNPVKYGVNIQRALNISDYDCAERRAELTWLAVQARTRKRIAEVGTYKGATARAMADNTSAYIWCIDTFAGSVGEVEMAKLLAEHGPEWLYETCRSNLADLKNVTIVREPSVQAVQHFHMTFDQLLTGTYRPFDMIFLDASHDYESVKADILAWKVVLAPDGLLCGHDRQWDGVAKAIDELLPGHQVGVGAIWYWGQACAF